MSQQQFENFTASSLYCEKCRAMPVRERLLLILPDKEIYDYLCTGCGSSVGQREVTAGEKMTAQRWRRAAAPSHPRSSESSSKRAMRVLFIGTGEIGLPVLRWLVGSPRHELVGVVTQPDKPVGRDQRIEPPPIKAALADSTSPSSSRSGSKRMTLSLRFAR
jgi:hypothetical protein